MVIREFTKEIYDGKSEIIIYGTTIGGKIIYQILKEMGFNISFFCDRSYVDSLFCELPVKKPIIVEQYPDAFIIIALTRSFDSACQLLESFNVSTVYHCSGIIDSIKINDLDYDVDNAIPIADFLSKYSNYANKDFNNKIIFNSLELFITEKCTLKCRDCSHLIPYYKNPQNYDVDDLLLNMQKLLNVVNKIQDLIILGGEPFLHPQLYKIIDFLSKEEKIDCITIITNATIIPKEKNIWCLQNDKVRVRLSDYGKYSIKLKEIYSLFDDLKINYFINRESWVDMGNIDYRNYTEEELDRIFMDCPFSYDLLFLNGKLFRCAHVAHLHNMDIIGKEEDYIDFKKRNIANEIELKEKINDYMNVKYLFGCNYCNGIINSKKGIEPGIQLSIDDLREL